jgi:RNA polymerase sigma factor (sigma-70 family)
MAHDVLRGLLRGLRQAAPDGQGPSDGDLLESYVACCDDAAFEALLRRHGPMVLGVCRRILGNEADAEDAFQATFLILVRKAANLHSGGLVGSWLYRVAHNTARKARAMSRQRWAREREAAAAVPKEQAAEEAWRQVQALLDEEVSRLPEKYRATIVLCELQGKTIEQAARELGCPQGTLATRLARGRALLGKRLAKHGLALPAGVIAAGLSTGSASAVVPAALLTSTADAARLFAAGQALHGVVPAAVLSLTEGVMKSMFLTRFKIATAVLLVAAGVLGGAAWAYARLASAVTGADEKRPGATSRSASGDAKAERELEGEWRLIEMKSDGRTISRFRLLLNQQIFHFEGDRFRVTDGGRDSFAPGTRFKLDPSQKPRAIDLIVSRGGKTFTFLGIYSVEKGRLRLCISFAQPGKRPTEFKPDKANGVDVQVLERVGPDGRGPGAGSTGERAAQELAAILRDWGQLRQATEDGLDRARTAEAREKVRAESRARIQRLAQRCLKVARDDPDTSIGLAALCWAAARSPNLEAGKKALAALEGGRLAKADLGDLWVILETLRSPLEHEAEAERFALAVLRRVRRNLDHPDAAKLLCWVCTRSLYFDPPKAPRSFAAVAELIVERFADSPHIANFCQCLGSIGGTSRVWARDYEKHLRAILKVNRTRRVRAAAHFALARVVQSTGAARQAEAGELFRSFLKEFDGKDPTLGTEQQYRTVAAREIAEIEARGIGKTAQEITGEDLDGKAMKLSDFKGKVVLLSFWGTWCPPCMAFVPHERKLVERLKDAPFAIVGVNQDRYDDDFRARLAKEKITWRSFRNRVAGKRAISEAWGVTGWPTVYLIDHKGVIRGRWVGMPDAKELDGGIDRLIAAVKRRE